MDELYVLAEPQIGPELPSRFSYTTLSEVEHCPRRWWLTRATYQFGERYPTQITKRSVRGIVIHGAVEKFASHIERAGNPPLGSDEYIAARLSFDVREVIRALRAAILAKPVRRGRPLRPDDVPLDECIDAFKRLLSFGYEAEGAGTTNPSHHPDEAEPVEGRLVSQHAPRPIGSLQAEVRVSTEDPPLVAVVDQVRTEALGDRFVDFKSGDPRPEHKDQADLYAAVWIRARGRAVTGRRIVYADSAPLDLGAVSIAEGAASLERIRTRVTRAWAMLGQLPPVAITNSGYCGHCPVRQLCDEYWASEQTAVLRWGDLGEGELGTAWKDLELRIDGAAATAADLSLPLAGGGRLHCSIPPSFRPSNMEEFDRVRLVGVSMRRQGSTIDIVWSAASEAFWRPRGAGRVG